MDINLNKYARQQTEKNPFDFNTAPPQRPVKATDPEQRLREIVQAFEANDRSVDEYKRLGIEGDKLCRSLPAAIVERIFTEVGGPAT